MSEINNLQLELKRHRLNLEFIRMIDLDSQSNSQDVSQITTNKEIHGKIAESKRDIPFGSHGNTISLYSTPDSSNSNNEVKHHLDLEDTEHPDLKIGLQKMEENIL